MRLNRVNNPPYLLQLFISKLNVSRDEILFHPLRLRRARNRNHTLHGNPSKRDLSHRGALSRGQFLNFIDDGFILVKVVTLKLGNCGGLLV